jgi:uncharacterized membrane protein YfcA
VSLFLAVIAAFLGISLGLLGAGGAIVAVPAMVYLEGLPPTVASGYALFVVAVGALTASLRSLRAGGIDWRAAIAFGSTTSVTIAIVRSWIVPALPEVIPGIGIARDVVLMLAFGAVLLGAGRAMLRRPAASQADAPLPSLQKLALYGVAIGAVSGFLGVGGGFLMTPALVLWARLDMRRAVATSLVLIGVNSAVGVTSDLVSGAQYNWPFVLTFTGITTAGIIVGMAVSKRIPAAALRKAFGWFVVVLGLAVVVREVVRLV